MKFAIVGTGPAALGAVEGILSRRSDARIQVFDFPQTPVPEPEQAGESSFDVDAYYDGLYKEIKENLGLRFPPLKTHLGKPLERYEVAGTQRLWRSATRGGLSNFWGGTMLPLNDRETASWPFGSDRFAPYYRKIAGLVGISGCRDGLTEYLGEDHANLPPVRVLKGLERLSEAINDSGETEGYRFCAGRNRIALETRREQTRHCVYCGECMAGCFRGSVFSSRTYFRARLSRPEMSLVTGRVTRVDPDLGRIGVESARGEDLHEGFERIYLCAGCIGSTEILMRSLDIRKGPVVRDNAVYQYPILNLGGATPRAESRSYLSLTSILSINLPVAGDLPVSQTQFYPNFDYLWRLAVPEPLWPLLSPLVTASRDRIIWARMFVHSDQGYAYECSLDEKNALHFQEIQRPDRRDQARLLASFRRSLKGSGFAIPRIPASISKTSSHLSSGFPYGGPLLELGPDGRVGSRLHLCDSACFPEGSAISPTFTIMANAFRTAAESLQ